MHDFLSSFGSKHIKSRVVDDRNRITGAGGTAGIDLALHLVARLCNEKMAQAVQLANEYDPQPPFHAGTPNTAPLQVLRWSGQ